MNPLAEFSLNENLNQPNIIDQRPLWERRKNLHGIVMKAGWTAAAPFMYLVNDTQKSERELSGVNYDLAKSLSSILNFTLEMEEVDFFGSLQLDGTWTGIVEKLRTKQLDLGIVDMAVTFERANVIDFSVGLQDEEFVLIMKSPEQALQWMTFIGVFSVGFWPCFITFIFTLTIFLSTLQIYGLGIIFRLVSKF